VSRDTVSNQRTGSMDNGYHVRIFFKPEENGEIEEKRFRCLLARSPQGAITKAFELSRKRNGGEHSNYGCKKITIEITCLGPVDQ
jgi:hypothetical protein